MKIKEFEQLFCQDILKRKERAQALLADDGLPFDGYETDEDGSKYKVVYAPDESIRLEDILSLDRESFVKEYPNPRTLKTYDRYMEGVITEEGIDVLIRVRNQMKAEAARLHDFDDLPQGLI